MKEVPEGAWATDGNPRIMQTRPLCVTVDAATDTVARPTFSKTILDARPGSSSWVGASLTLPL